VREKRGFQYWRNEALRQFQKYRRYQESTNGYVRCISCNKLLQVKSADGGHYIPRNVRITELEPDNVWPQCKQCNAFKEGNTVAYRVALVKLIGEERVQRIENLCMAASGSEEHFNLLSDEDKLNVARKRCAADYEGLARYYAQLNRKRKHG
jgi:phage FluMu protein Com